MLWWSEFCDRLIAIAVIVMTAVLVFAVAALLWILVSHFIRSK